MSNQNLIDRLNEALAFELRAETMYAHYSAYVSGIHRLHLQPFFEAEAQESFVHAGIVRASIVKLGGIALTERDSAPIKHTTDYREILEECLKTERKAAQTYGAILEILPNNDDELYDSLQQVFFAEQRSVEEITRLL